MATKYVQTTEHRPKGRHENNHNPIFDTVLQAAVKKQEELLQASAPHFGYASIKEADHVWAQIGKEWFGRDKGTAKNAYAERYPTGLQIRYADAGKLAVTRGERDAELKWAAACAFEVHGVDRNVVHRYLRAFT